MTSKQQSRQQIRTRCASSSAASRETPTAGLIDNAGHSIKFQNKSIETMLHLAAASECLVRRTFPRSATFFPLWASSSCASYSSASQHDLRCQRDRLRTFSVSSISTCQTPQTKMSQKHRSSTSNNGLPHSSIITTLDILSFSYPKLTLNHSHHLSLHPHTAKHSTLPHHPAQPFPYHHTMPPCHRVTTTANAAKHRPPSGPQDSRHCAHADHPRVLP
jgi:hypothetical protein